MLFFMGMRCNYVSISFIKKKKNALLPPPKYKAQHMCTADHTTTDLHSQQR